MKKEICKRGHSRISSNVNSSGNCIICKNTITNPSYDRTVSGRFNRLKTNSILRKIEINISLNEYEKIVSNPCFYCGGSLPSVGSGIDRIDSSIGYIIENIRPCCTICNQAKNKMSELEFKEWILKVLKHWVTERVPECAEI